MTYVSVEDWEWIAASGMAVEYRIKTIEEARQAKRPKRWRSVDWPDCHSWRLRETVWTPTGKFARPVITIEVTPIVCRLRPGHLTDHWDGWYTTWNREPLSVPEFDEVARKEAFDKWWAGFGEPKGQPPAEQAAS